MSAFVFHPPSNCFMEHKNLFSMNDFRFKYMQTAISPSITFSPNYCISMLRSTTSVLFNSQTSQKSIHSIKIGFKNKNIFFEFEPSSQILNIHNVRMSQNLHNSQNMKIRAGNGVNFDKYIHVSKEKQQNVVGEVHPEGNDESELGEDEDEEEEEQEAMDFSVEEMEKEASRIAFLYKQKLLSDIVNEEELEIEEESVKKKGKKGKKIKPQYDTNVPDHLLPKIAIIGRPNVGKSALFNRIAGREIAIVYDEPGVTRDRQYTQSSWGKKFFMVADTGGVMTVSSSQKFSSDALAIASARGSESIAKALKESAEAGLPSLIERQAMEAVEEAHAIIFVVDGQAGLTAADVEISNWLRKKYSHKKVSLAVNKCESSTKGYYQISDFYSLGFDPIPVSAISGTGSGDLLDEITADLPSPEELEESDENEKPLSIAIVGRPNVGKSSILNSLIGKERAIISPVSGTTRDAIDTFFQGKDGRPYCLIDTAGIRKRSAVVAGNVKTEILSINRAMRAIRRTDVVVLVIEAMQCVTEQDYRLAERIEKEGKACVIVINKWDTVPEKDGDTMLTYEQDVRDKLTNIPWAPVVYTSAINGQRINKVLETARKAGDERAKRISTAVLNTVVRESFFFQKPSIGKGGKRGKIFYCTQAAIRPPTFVFFVNDSKLFPESYRRYMEKQIRQNIGFPGSPVRLLWRSKKKNENEKNSKEKKN